MLLRHDQFELVRSGLGRLRTLGLHEHISTGQNAVQSVVGAQKECGLVGVALSGCTLQVRVIEHDLMRILGDGCPDRSYGRRGSAAEHEIHLRLQCKDVVLGGIIHAHGRSVALRQAKVDSFESAGVARLLIEHQAAGREVDGVLELFGRSLVGIQQALRVCP